MNYDALREEGGSTRNQASPQGVSVNEHEHTEYKVYPQRWPILFGFAIFAFVMGLSFIVLTVVDKRTREYYNIDSEAMVMNTNVIMISFFPLAIPAAMLVNKSIKWSQIGACAFMTVGSWVKYFGGPNYFWLMFGQTLVAIGNVPLFCAIAPIAARWFSIKEQGLAIAIPFVINYIASALPFPIESPLLEHGVDIPDVLLFMAIASSVSLLVLCIFLKEYPPSPPSALASIKPAPICDDLKVLFKDARFLMFAFAYGSIVSIGYSVITVITEIVDPNGHHNVESGWMGFVFNVVGAICSLGFEQITHRITNLDGVMKGITFVGILSFIALAICTIYKVTALLYILIAIAGACTVGITPICIQCGLELSYPVTEANSSQIIIIVANAWSAIVNAIVSLPGMTKWAFWIMGGILVYSLVIVSVLKFEYKRRNFNRKISDMTENDRASLVKEDFKNQAEITE